MRNESFTASCIAILFMSATFFAGPLFNRLGAKPLAVLGAACITAAPFLFSQVDGGSGYTALVPGMVVLGIGIGSFYPTATTAGVTSVDESQTAVAGRARGVAAVRRRQAPLPHETGGGTGLSARPQ